jgi:hypothetical protein
LALLWSYPTFCATRSPPVEQYFAHKTAGKNIDFDIGAKFDTPKTTQQIHFLVPPDYFSIQS